MRDHDRRVRLEGLFAEHASVVRAYARRRIGVALADDALSEVFVIAWRRIDDVPADPLPWLLACARRVVANQRRTAARASRLTERLSDRARLPTRVGGGDGSLALALDGLAESDRELLLLIAWEGLSVAQAARVLDCSSNAASVRLHRARRRLMKALEARELDSVIRREGVRNV